MNSRVEKFSDLENETELPSRVARNQSLYNDLSVPDFSNMKPNDNIRVIENTGNRIDLSKIRDYLESNNEEEVQNKNVVVKDDIEVIPSNDLFYDEKDYDINSILEKAKEKKESYYEDEKHKKLRDTQYDILSKIKVYDEVEDESEPTEKVELNTNERTLIDLVNTVTKNKTDLLEELKKGSENTIVTSPINEESNDEIIKDAIEESKKEEISDLLKEFENNKKESNEDLINELEKSKKDINTDLFKEFKSDEKKEESFELKEVDNDETSIKNLDKSFYTNSMSFSKEDFEGFDELEKSVKKNNKMVKLGIFALVILALATIFIVLKYVLNLF